MQFLLLSRFKLLNNLRHMYSFKIKRDILYTNNILISCKYSTIDDNICELNPISKLQEFLEIPLIKPEDLIYNKSDCKFSMYFKRDIKELKGVANSDMLPQTSKLPEVNTIR